MRASDGQRVRIWNCARGQLVAERVVVAAAFWSRFRGLMFRSGWGQDDGLWLVPCRQIHTFGMRFPIDVAFLDHQERIVYAIPALPPGRISPYIREAQSVLELPAGTLERVGACVGDYLLITASGDDGKVAERVGG